MFGIGMPELIVVFVIALLLKDFLAVDFNGAVGRTVLYTVGDSTPGTRAARPRPRRVVAAAATHQRARKAGHGVAAR